MTWLQLCEDVMEFEYEDIKKNNLSLSMEYKKAHDKNSVIDQEIK